MNQLLNAKPQLSTAIVGFDSAWADSPKAPGAICAIVFDDSGKETFIEPRLTSFGEAVSFINGVRANASLCLVALDQPTVVPNGAGMRPVERVVGSVVSYVGGGVQPAHRGKLGLFCDNAPVWRFLDVLGATQSPELSRTAEQGLFLIEVFPALALPSLESRFAERLRGPRYNPTKRKRFSRSDWDAVARVLAVYANRLSVPQLAAWAESMISLPVIRKSEQDQLDAALCALIGLIWRACDRQSSAIIGDVETGYMISPISEATRARLQKAAAVNGVPIA